MQRLALDNLELGALDSGFAICIQLRPWSSERRRPLELWTSEPRTLCMGTLSLGTLQLWTLDGPELAALEPRCPSTLGTFHNWTTLGPLDLAIMGHRYARISRLGGSARASAGGLLPSAFAPGWAQNVIALLCFQLERKSPALALKKPRVMAQAGGQVSPRMTRPGPPPCPSQAQLLVQSAKT